MKLFGPPSVDGIVSKILTMIDQLDDAQVEAERSAAEYEALAEENRTESKRALTIRTNLKNLIGDNA